jgi:hypothetical protein
MKGIELPINVLVIIVIVLVVLLAVVAMFFGGFTPATGSTSLQSATTATCMRVNPIYCNYNQDDYKTIAARMPVYDFDANNNDILNEHNPVSSYATSTGDDNLEMLCINYYNCQYGGSGGPTAPAWTAWYNCCLKKVCGCP